MANAVSQRKVGIVHDWLPLVGGGERVLEQIVAEFPDSKIYTVFDFLSKEQRDFLSHGNQIESSSLNRLPFVRKYYRSLLLMCTREIEKFDVTGHEIVISSSAAFAKGVLTSPDQKHVAYIHSPARYAWDLAHEYVSSISGPLGPIKRVIAREMMHRFRIWDMRTIDSVDRFVVNSKFIQRRVWKLYRRESEVVYPPVDIHALTLNESPSDYYVTASRMVPYKRIPLIVEAFAKRPRLRLKVIGDGPEMAIVKRLATPNVEILGHVNSQTMSEILRNAKCFVFAAKEDFGIAPVEAQACGTPVIGLGEAGTAETVVPLTQPNPTGIWFQQQTLEDICGAIDRFEAEGTQIKRLDCRINAEKFSPELFRERLRGAVEAV